MLDFATDLIRLADSSAYTKATKPVDVAALVAYIQDPDNCGGETEPAVLLRIVLGARHLTTQLRALELQAAWMARGRRVTVRELAAAAGISERAATDRYRLPNDRPAE